MRLLRALPAPAALVLAAALALFGGAPALAQSTPTLPAGCGTAGTNSAIASVTSTAASITVTWKGEGVTGICYESSCPGGLQICNSSGTKVDAEADAIAPTFFGTTRTYTKFGTAANAPALTAATDYWVRWFAYTSHPSAWTYIRTQDAGTPTVTIAAGPSPVTEGTAATFTVSRTGATTAALTVNLSISESGGDYVAASDEGTKTVTIAAGSASATHSVATHDDSTAESQGTVTVAVSPGTGYGVGAGSSASVTVNDNELGVVPTFSSATVASTSLVVTFSETLDTGSVPAPNAFHVTVGSARWNVASGGVAIDGADVTLTLPSAVAGGDTVKVRYTRPSANPLKDIAGIEVKTFADRDVTNITSAPAAPAAPTVSKTDGTSLSVRWAAPGGGTATDYDVRFRRKGATGWTEHAHTGAGLRVSIGFED